MKILLATDGSRSSQAALRMLITQYRSPKTQVRVLHVVVPVDVALPLEMSTGMTLELRDLQKRQLKQARKLVEGAAQKLRDAGFKPTTAVVQGNARAAIIDVAAKWRADLIVLGSHGRKGLDRFLIGSVSEYVARHAPCSVLIVRSRKR